MESRTIFRRLSIELVLVCVISGLLALYGGDYLMLRCRMALRGEEGVTSNVTIYYAARLKDGKVSVFYDQPQTQHCVRAFFPWLGDEPCWYVRRHALKIVG